MKVHVFEVAVCRRLGNGSPGTKTNDGSVVLPKRQWYEVPKKIKPVQVASICCELHPWENGE